MSNTSGPSLKVGGSHRGSNLSKKHHQGKGSKESLATRKHKMNDEPMKAPLKVSSMPYKFHTPTAKKILMKEVDISEEMRLEAVKVALEALAKHKIGKDIATFIKNRFDELYEPYWQCFAGYHFAASVTHQTRNFVLFTVDTITILLYRKNP